MFRFTQEPSSGSNLVVYCACRYTDEDNKPYFVVLANHRIALWWWFLREPKHVGAGVIILYCFNILWF